MQEDERTIERAFCVHRLDVRNSVCVDVLQQVRQHKERHDVPVNLAAAETLSERVATEQWGEALRVG